MEACVFGIHPQPVPRYAQAFLSRPAARGHRWVAGGTAAAVLVATAILMPMAGLSAPTLSAFLPMTIVALTLGYGFTSLLLGLQANQLRHPTLALLAGAYSFMAGVHFVQLLMVPGALSPNGLLGAGPQSANWLGLVARVGFPFWVMLAILQMHRARSRLTVLSAWLVPAACAPVCALSLGAFESLPVLVEGNRYSHGFVTYIAPLQALLYGLTLIALVAITRLRTRLHLWLAVVVFAMLAEIVLSLTAGGRFTVGWYTARLLTVCSSTVLLAALLWDIHDLYSRLQRINAELHEDATRDGLTGVFQRRYLDRFLKKSVHDHARAVALVLFDVDRFKMYNDRFGHPMGDACLTAVAQALADGVPAETGFVARYGGEEMAVVLLGSAADQAGFWAEQLRKRVEDLNLQHAPEAHQPWITVSGGWAQASGERWTPASLVERADGALYAAKHSGRNRVCGATDS